MLSDSSGKGKRSKDRYILKQNVRRFGFYHRAATQPFMPFHFDGKWYGNEMEVKWKWNGNFSTKEIDTKWNGNGTEIKWKYFYKRDRCKTK